MTGYRTTLKVSWVISMGEFLAWVHQSVKAHPKYGWNCSSWGPQLNKKEVSWGSSTHLSLLLDSDAVWTAVSCSYCSDCLAMMDWTLKLWTQINRSFPKMLWLGILPLQGGNVTNTASSEERIKERELLESLRPVTILLHQVSAKWLSHHVTCSRSNLAQNIGVVFLSPRAMSPRMVLD